MNALIVQHLATTAILALLVAGICRVLRPGPALRHALWVVVLVKLLVPPVVAWPWAVPLAGNDPAARMPAGAPAGAPAATTAEAPPAETLPPPTVPGPMEVRSAASPPPPPVTRARGGISAATWGRAALAAWACGAAVLALVHAAHILRFRSMFAVRRDAPEFVTRATAELARQFGVRAPEVSVVEGAGSPLFWNLGKPRLILPSALVAFLERGRMNGVIAHELAHLKRRDHWVRWIEMVAGCVWWWNPVYWIARRQLRESAELACDAWVVWALPEHREDYAKTLLEVSELVSCHAAPIAALGMSAGAYRSFERRLTMILEEYVPHRVPARALAAIMVLALAVLPGWAQEAAPPAGDAPPAAAAPKANADVPPPPPPPTPAVDEELAQALDSPVSVEFTECHVEDILKFIRDYVSVNFSLDYRVVRPQAAPEEAPSAAEPGGGEQYATDGVLPYIKLDDVRLKDCLKAILIPLNLDYSAQGSFIWVSTPERIKSEPFYEPAVPAGQEELGEILESPVSIEFDEEHIVNVCQFISDYSGLNIAFDYRVVPAPKPNPPEGAPPVEGDLAGGYLPAVRLADIPLAQALQAILRPLDLYYAVGPGFIWISTPEGIRQSPFAPAQDAAGGQAAAPAKDTRYYYYGAKPKE
ncbi:MAG: M48 family metalloprotease [Candidatus Hydrogenedentes bacterium]|nr:M48 family metalloprotease [Candidatus Hydrogenedentota bacterium]